ncbi:tail fiber domain-containing protein [bacterium]|nr:tail fiber domain-containing protein [bacterium]
MIKRLKFVGVLLVGAFALGQAGQIHAADANPPERMTYQGFLVDGNGAALAPTVPANYDVVFRIYNVKQGGTAIWAEQQTVTVDKGYFSVLLGEGVSTASGEPNNDLSAALDGADASDRYIGITVGGLGGGDVEIAPRLRLVTSPFAFTATQARRLTDGSGNANFYKDGSALKLGAGTTTTLTLPEAGGATLAGKLTASLSGWGAGLQIDNDSSSTTLKGDSTGFSFMSDLPKFYFNKELQVDGGIRSYNQDAVIGPSNNGDNYLKILSASDTIEANTDRFLLKGDSHYLDAKFTSNKVELHTDAASIFMNKPLAVDGKVSAGSIEFAGGLGLTAMTGNYATVQTVGERGGAGGYSINGKYNFMANGDRYVGVFNDIDDKWMWLYDRDIDRYMWHDKTGAPQFEVNTSGIKSWDGDLTLTRFVQRAPGNGSYGQGRHNFSVGSASGNLDISVEDGNVYFFHWKNDTWNTHGYLNGDGHWRSGSDRRLKKNIIDHEDVLDRVMRLQIRRFDFNYSETDHSSESGVVAQEVLDLFPEVVSAPESELDLETGAGAMSVAYSKFGVVAVKAIQELRAEKDAEIESLRDENKALKTAMDNLISRLELIEARTD